MRPIVFVLFSLVAAGQASAGTLYRCVGGDGIPNYTSSRVKGAECTTVAKTSSRVTVAAPAPKPTMPVTQPLREPTVADAAATAPAAPTEAASAPVAAGTVAFQAVPAGATAVALKPSAGARVLRGAVYRYEKNGVTHYTNVRPRGAGQSKLLFSYVESCYACGVLPGVNFGNVRLNTAAFTNEIRNAAQKFGVEEAVVRAVIHAESAYRPNAVSHAGAQGLMQLIPATASRFGVSDPFDPAQNIQGGVKYLAWLMKRYSSDLTLVAAAYNAGEGAVDRNGGVPPYSETRRYVQRVGQLADRYRTALAGP
jgi:soluble lytic murein transglycosylase-like protein